MATGPGFYDNLCPQSWQDGSAATFTLNDPHQQSEQPAILMSVFCQERPQATVACAVCPVVAFRWRSARTLRSLRLPGQLN